VCGLAERGQIITTDSNTFGAHPWHWTNTTVLA
jgi:hypothetical protein